MIRGKVQTDGNLIKRLPAIQIDGELSRLKAGEKLIFEMEVVANKSLADASVDFVFLSQDINFTGLFKVGSFVIQNGVKADMFDVLSTRELVKRTSIDFNDWITKGNLPLNAEFNVAEKLKDFVKQYPAAKMRWPMRKFTEWIDVYAQQRNGTCLTNQHDKDLMRIVTE